MKAVISAKPSPNARPVIMAHPDWTIVKSFVVWKRCRNILSMFAIERAYILVVVCDHLILCRPFGRPQTQFSSLDLRVKSVRLGNKLRVGDCILIKLFVELVFIHLGSTIQTISRTFFKKNRPSKVQMSQKAILGPVYCTIMSCDRI